MADIVGQPIWKDRVRKHEASDPVAPSTWDPIHTDLINNDVYLKGQIDALNNEVAAARGGYANLDARLDALETQTLQGESTFNSTAGRTITHNLGHTNYIVNIVPLQDTGGDLGDVYISKAANAFTVYNTGGFTGSFRYQLIT
ncbi:hypothetical protein G7K71_08690 [Desulfofundulus sp. TPOSR]|uniref:hypothetical protein n=1 Tax=Desulfofundulus sp. TPOSR TaxID=2714340 RepID=UPI0014076A19|nr:hypothetical protein [Desulfofundulus sp. TPOSR]NHM25473.1 hypothetical protein [Desulfofundulus sp. TPOSR]NHM27061.1 hypothetical protein [Desulfofundulus sp. TPOSR]